MVKEIHKIIKNHPSPPSQNKSKRLLVLHSKERLLISFKIVNGELVSPQVKIAFYRYSSLADNNKIVSLSFK